jgi:hypothetical protein
MHRHILPPNVAHSWHTEWGNRDAVVFLETRRFGYFRQTPPGYGVQSAQSTAESKAGSVQERGVPARARSPALHSEAMIED